MQNLLFCESTIVLSIRVVPERATKNSVSSVEFKSSARVLWSHNFSGKITATRRPKGRRHICGFAIGRIERDVTDSDQYVATIKFWEWAVLYYELTDAFDFQRPMLAWEEYAHFLEILLFESGWQSVDCWHGSASLVVSINCSRIRHI